jgi:hypothetical protein
VCLSWAAFYEGRSDSAYFNVLLPRVIEDALRIGGNRPYDVGVSPAVQFGVEERRFEIVSAEICARREEFHILFVHADSGGRAQAQAIENRREALVRLAEKLCNFDRGSAVMLSPRRELEAWALSDADAIASAFGVGVLPPDTVPGAPEEAERLADPKAALREVGRRIGRRRDDSKGVLVRIAQAQRLDQLRKTVSFREFEEDLLRALRHVGFLH